MTALETITAKAEEKGLRFLVIGGHAVMAHGFARSTYDLDLLVRANEQEQWQALLQEKHASTFAEGPNFIQYQASSQLTEAIDLLLVHERIFEPLWQASFSPSQIQARFVSLEHLIQLKVHALKHGGDTWKHRRDLSELIHTNKMTVPTEVLELPEHPLTKEIATWSFASPEQDVEEGDLVFPDWNGMKEHPRMSFDQAYRCNQELTALFPPKPDEAARRLEARCLVEFTL
ncbi:MAG: hypothetical protein ACO1QS_04015 [Verrucomicrobiota bacterium]